MTRPPAPVTPRRRPALSGTALVVLYVALTAGPVLGAAVIGGMHAPTVLPILARAAGVAALAMLLMQFLTSGRFETISGRIGLDRTMGFHRLAAIAALLMIAAHVVFFLFRGAQPGFGQALSRLVAYLTAPGLTTGVAATVLAVVLVIVARSFRGRGLPYPVWRLGHGVAATLVAALALHHGYANARFMADPLGGGAIALVAALALGSLAFVYAVRPIQAFRHGFRVETARRLAPSVCELVLTAPADGRFDFEAGQFAWLTIGRRHTVTDNPFSIASVRQDLPRLRFLIRDAGDMSGAVAGLMPGTPVGVDGPHGSFTLAEAGPGPLLFVAGGIGIAPVLSIIRQLSVTADGRPVRLIAGARTPADHVMRAELEDLGRALDFAALYLADEDGEGPSCEQGTCTTDHVARLMEGLDIGAATAFVCGPPAMMEHAAPVLLDSGIPLKHIVMERFDFDAGHDAVCNVVRRRFVGVLVVVFAIVAAAALTAAW
ncbi:MAG: hypothetical protein F9K19_25075 [Rhizobiaceae bacterium]|nr:MAG: hypothetical protein F9K19_25075 [Rhizobiaceae bacterium]